MDQTEKFTEREKQLLEDLEAAGANENMKQMVYSIMRQRKIKEKSDKYLEERLKKTGRITEQDKVDALIAIAEENPDDEAFVKFKKSNEQPISARKRLFEAFVQKDIDEKSIQTISYIFSTVRDKEKLAGMTILLLRQGKTGEELVKLVKEKSEQIKESEK